MVCSSKMIFFTVSFDHQLLNGYMLIAWERDGNDDTVRCLNLGLNHKILWHRTQAYDTDHLLLKFLVGIA
jgi:hypothetical protein